MKKTTFFILIIGLIFFCVITVLAGDVPEGLLSEDNAVLFFGEIVSYDATDKNITVLPTKKIKGDVSVDVSRIYKDVTFVGKDGFTPVEGEIYLMANYDGNNPLYVFRTTSDDTETLKIEGITGIDMWERMQKYLNEGAYEKKETERLERVNESTSSPELSPTHIPSITPNLKPISESTSTNILQQDLTNYWWYGLFSVIIVVGLIVYLRNRKKRKNKR